MKMNNRLYQYFIILFALGHAPFVLASDNSVDNKKEQAEMPPAPSGPYRTQSENNQAKQKVNNMQRSVPAMLAQQSTQRPHQAQWKQPPQQHQRMAPNRNRNIPPQVQWNQRPLQQMHRPVAPPAWVNQVPPQQRMAPNRNRNIPPQAQWNQRPPQQMQPPVWANNAPQHRVAPNWNRNVPPQPQWQQPKVPEWVTNPPAPPAWVNNAPHQRRQAPPVPDWVKNPPYGHKPPAWVTNPPRQPMYPYGNRGR